MRREQNSRVDICVKHPSKACSWVPPLSKHIFLLTFACLRPVFRCRFIVIISFDKNSGDLNVVGPHDATVSNVPNFFGEILLFLSPHKFTSRSTGKEIVRVSFSHEDTVGF